MSTGPLAGLTIAVVGRKGGGARLRGILVKHGARVTEPAGVPEPADLLVADLRTGWDPRRVAAIAATWPEVPLLALGPFDREDARIAAFRAGADACVPAAVTEQELVAWLTALRRRGEAAVAARRPPVHSRP